MASDFSKCDDCGPAWGNTISSSPVHYKSAIDGLRAIAVILVLAYHLDVPFFPGGFVGVDIFFVISGYLMTSRIAANVHSGNFSYSTYLARRIRRLLPAAAVMSFVTCLVAVAIFPPAEIRAVLRSAIYNFFGLSNFRFWAQSGYFDQAAIMKPLLHTWSLAVEFQFYLVLPATAFIFLTFSPVERRKAVGLGLICVGVLISAVWLRIDPDGAYLLAPARVFEFGIGAAAASFNAQRTSSRVSKFCLASGLVTIACCAVLFSESLPFPGIAALLPTCGAALVLYAVESPVAVIVLGNRPMRSLGLISYSVYLVHWPIIVFATFYLDGLRPHDKVLIAASTLIFALALYWFVEQPFRHYPINSYRKLIARASFVAMLCTTAILLSIGDTAWTWRYRSELLSFIDPNLKKPAQQATWSLIKEVEQPFSNSKAAKIFIVGDSQAGDFTNVIRNAYGPSVEIRSAIRPSPCQVTASTTYYADFAPKFESECTELATSLLADPRVAQADTVVLAFNWYLESAAFIDADAVALKARGASRVFVVGPKQIGTDPMKLAAKMGSMKNLGEEIWRRIPEKLFQTNKAFSSAAQDFLYLNILDIVCPEVLARCAVVASDGAPVFYDHLHFTLSGASLVSKSKLISDMHLDQTSTHIANR